MALSIRNPETEAAVRELAATTGLSLTEAIDMAVRGELARRDNSEEAVEERRQRIQAATEWARSKIDPSALRSDADLYDEHGLPR